MVKFSQFVSPPSSLERDLYDDLCGFLASLVSGPLSETPAFCAKVATCPQSEVPHYQHVICLYMPNVYDKEAVTEVCVLFWHVFRSF